MFLGFYLIVKNLGMTIDIKRESNLVSKSIYFPCRKGTKLEIDFNQVISKAAVICHSDITIGNNVKIGGGARFYETDFRSLDPEFRINSQTNFADKRKFSANIEDNVFIVAYSTINKGVLNEKKSINGACSVVMKNVSSNEILAVSPLKFIKYLYD
jgi:acetyltransferase-like isoleucine patch superfamily enzyme